MNINRVSAAFFSPNSTTRQTIVHMTSNLNLESQEINLGRMNMADYSFQPDDLLFIGFPVYGGRLPKGADGLIAHLTGNNTPVVPVVAYGNRDFDDALLELANLLEPQGFVVVAGAACLAQHCMYPALATGRPDKNDGLEQAAFGLRVMAKLERLPAITDLPSLNLPGNFPYGRPTMNGVFTPVADDRCNRCGLCVDACYFGAINPETPNMSDATLCQTCLACVNICPLGCRAIVEDAFKNRDMEMRKLYGSQYKTAQYVI